MELLQIIQGVKQGEEWACRALLDQYGDRLFRVAYGILRDRQLAEDSVQEVFLKIFQKIHQYKTDCSFYAWVYKITVNHCRNKMRGWSFKRLFFIDQYRGQMEGEESSAEDSYIKDEAGQTLLSQVMSLPEMYREVLLLFYYEEQSIKEIVQILGLNENTVKTRLNRGRQMLRVSLETEEVFQNVIL